MHRTWSFKFHVPSLLLCISIFLSSPLLTTAALVNVTIDDTLGDLTTGINFTYNPPSAWAYGPTCTGCTAHPDPAQAFDGTWHDATYNPVSGSNDVPDQIIVASVDFNGQSRRMV